MTHPNAFATAITTAIAAGLLALAHRIGYVHLTGVQAIAVAGGVISAVLFIGKRGLRPVLSQIWNGTQKAISGEIPPGA